MERDARVVGQETPLESQSGTSLHHGYEARV